MKRIIAFTLAAVLAVLTSLAATNGAPISFSQTSHDFGTIRAGAGSVTAEFDFKNNSDEPVAILTVTNGGCGCTKPSFPKKPVMPGKTAKIKITFNPQGRSGEFNREVKVRYASASKKGKLALRFSGVIIPE